MQRNCGYCKEAGHQKPKCPLFLDHRNQVLTHTPYMRKKVLDAIVKCGFGVGTIFEYRRDADSINGIAMIQDYNFIANLNFMEHKKVRYSKQVRLQKNGIDDFYGGVYFQGIAMWDGVSQKRTMHIPYNQLRGAQENYIDRRVKILSPSHDYPEIDPMIFTQYVRMPIRLVTRPVTTDEKWNGYILETGIMPPL